MDILSQESDGGRIVSRRTPRNARLYPDLTPEKRLDIALAYRDAIVMGYSGKTVDDIRRDPDDHRRFICGKDAPEEFYDKPIKAKTTNNLHRAALNKAQRLA